MPTCNIDWIDVCKKKKSHCDAITLKYQKLLHEWVIFTAYGTKHMIKSNITINTK